MSNIPISYGSQQRGEQVETQQRWRQQQQEPFVSSRESQQTGWQQQIPVGTSQQQFGKTSQMEQQLPSQVSQREQQMYGKPSMEQFQQQGKGYYEHPSQVPISEPSQFAGIKGGEWSEKNLKSNNVGVTDLACLHILLRLSGTCYIKEHVLMKLADDTSGVLRDWHKNVTIKNLDTFSELAIKFGLTLPFPKSLEQREQQIKSSLQNVGQVITEGEALMDLCQAAHLLCQEFACGFMSGVNPEFKEACRVGCGVVSENYLRLKEAIRNTEQYFPPPYAKTVVIHEGITTRR
jgi:hypothetical protein